MLAANQSGTLGAPPHMTLSSTILEALGEQHALAEDIVRLVGVLGERHRAVERRLVDALEQVERATDSPPPPTSPESTVVVRCFGSFEVRIDGTAIDAWRAGKS